MTDQHLLSEFARHRSEAAFAELVARHAAWVRATAARTVGDGPAADDVVQAVFLALAAKAPRLAGRTDLTGWLFHATRYAVARVRRSDRRRRVHERAAARPEVVMPPAEPDWTDVAPLLDDLVAGLASRDRQAVLLRFHRQLPLAAVGAAMGTSEQAARAQVRRAVDRLRVRLGRRGVTGATVDGLTATLTAHLVPRPVPADAAAAVARAASRRRPPVPRFRVAAGVVGGAVLATAAVGLLATGSKPSPAPPPAPPPAAAVVAAVDESTVPGQTDVVRWDVLLTPAGGRAVAGLGQPVGGDEHVYHGMTVNAATLRRAVADQAAAGRVVGSDRPVFVGEGIPAPGGDGPPLILAAPFFYGGGDNRTVQMNGVYDGKVGLDQAEVVDADHVRLTVDRSTGAKSTGLAISEPDGHGQFATSRGIFGATMRFAGELAAGRSVAFLARLRAGSGTGYDHLMVYEAFKVDRADQAAVALERDSLGWCRLGPATLRGWAADARARRAGGVKQRTAGPAYSRPLAGGATVWLDGLARPAAHPFAQWDPRGRWLAEPFYLNLPGDPPPGLWVAVGVSGSGDFGPPWPVSHLSRSPLSDGAGTARPIGDHDTSVDVGVLVGSWAEAGRIRPGQPLVIGPATYRMVPSPGAQYWERTGAVSDDVAEFVTAVGPDGQEEGGHFAEYIRVRRPGAAPVTDHATGYADLPGELRAKDVAFYRLWRRRRQWVHFDGFAIGPKVAAPAAAPK